MNTQPAPPLRIAIVGAGWAGLAAAVHAVQAGHAVTVFEAAPQPGGRARGVPLTLPDGRELMVDNGQHILIGAYTESLRLMRTVGVDPESALLRLPLTLRFADGMGLRWPNAPEPLPAPLQNMLWWAYGRTRVERAHAEPFLTYPVGQLVGDMNEQTSVREVVQDMLLELAEARERLDAMLG